jgi:hypothetical protein
MRNYVNKEICKAINPCNAPLLQQQNLVCQYQSEDLQSVSVILKQVQIISWADLYDCFAIPWLPIEVEGSVDISDEAIVELSQS